MVGGRARVIGPWPGLLWPWYGPIVDRLDPDLVTLWVTLWRDPWPAKECARQEA